MLIKNNTKLKKATTMKTISNIIIALAIAIAPVTINAQQQGKSATQKPATEKKADAPKSEADLIKNAKPTGRTYTSKKTGQKYPVYQGKQGGLFVVRKSAKTGNWYKMYVKEEQLD